MSIPIPHKRLELCFELQCHFGLFLQLPLLALLILSPTFPVSASDQMVWNKSIYKGIRVKQPCLVLLAAKHRNKSLGMMKVQSFSKCSVYPHHMKRSFNTGNWSQSAAQMSSFYTAWMWCHDISINVCKLIMNKVCRCLRWHPFSPPVHPSGSNIRILQYLHAHMYIIRGS